MNKSWIISLVLGCILTLFLAKLNAQEKNLRFETLMPNPGLDPSFAEIRSDSQGFLWISTPNGLFKFNGYSTTKYLYDPFDQHSLSQNLIYTFWIDDKDTLWLGTPEGLCKFDRYHEKFIRYNNTLIPTMPDLGNVSAINGDDEGNLYIGNYEGKLWRYNREKGEFLSLTAALHDQEVRSMSTVFHDVLYFIFKDNSGQIWVGTNYGIHRLNVQYGKQGKGESFSFTHYRHDPLNSNSLSSNFVNGILQDHKKIYWIYSTEGLTSFDQKTGMFKRYSLPTNDRNSINDKSINRIVEGPDSNLWIATNNGLYRLNETRTLFSSWHQNLTDELGLRSSYITDLLIDKGGNLLLSTDNGIQSIFLHQKSFNLLQHDSANINSISTNSVTALAEDDHKNIWIGTQFSGLNKWDKSSGKFTHYISDPKNPGSLRDNYIGAVLQDTGGYLWVANREYLSLMKNGDGHFEHYNSNSRNLKDFDPITILSLCKDREGLIWLGTGNGIKSFDPATKKFNNYFYEPGNPDGIADYTVISIYADSKDNIWVGNNSIAFNRFDKKTGKFIHYKNNPLDSTSISSNMVNCVFEDSKGNLWLGTSSGGLCQYNYSNDHFITHTRNKVLPWTSVFSIREDNAGNIWLGTENGIACYLVKQGKFVTYDIKDGLQGNLFAAGFRFVGSSLKASNGEMYFGGFNGLNYFDPAQIQPNPYIPPIVITEFKIFDKLQRGKNEVAQIELNYDQNFFSFEFAALNYTNTIKNNYAYQLEDIDANWIYSGNRRYASYTNIPPGKYVFKVKGSNNDGIWNEKGITVTIIIHPPWWRTRWSYIIYGLLFISGIFLVDRVQRQRVIEKQRQASREKEFAQAKEIEKAYHQLKETQAQLIHAEKMASLGELTAGIAHEIQNPLNFVNNFSDVNTELIDEASKAIKQNNPDEAQSLLTSLRDNEEKIRHHGQRADAIVKSMLQHTRTNKGQKEPANLNALADEYLRLAYHGLRSRDKNFKVTLQTDFDEQIRDINIIPQDIGRVLLNLYNNAFYAVAEKIKTSENHYEPLVSISTKNFNNQVEIRVRDNGYGIPEKIKEKIFQPFFTTKPAGEGTGLGLSLSYDIIKTHGGSFKVESTENEGSEFIIQLPKT